MSSCWISLHRLLLLHICTVTEQHACAEFTFFVSLRWVEARVTAAECDTMKLKSQRGRRAIGRRSLLISALSTGVFLNPALAGTTESFMATLLQKRWAEESDIELLDADIGKPSLRLVRPRLKGQLLFIL